MLHRCEGQTKPLGIRCMASGTIESDGRWFCKIHAPAMSDDKDKRLHSMLASIRLNPHISDMELFEMESDIKERFGYAPEKLKPTPSTITQRPSILGQWANEANGDNEA